MVVVMEREVEQEQAEALSTILQVVGAGVKDICDQERGMEQVVRQEQVVDCMHEVDVEVVQEVEVVAVEGVQVVEHRHHCQEVDCQLDH